MNIETAHLICYSPTGTTLKTLGAIARGMSLPTSRTLDLTRPPTMERPFETMRGGVALIGIPVYAGRVAPVAAARLQEIRGENTPAVIVAVYGNRDYEGALVELKEIAEARGFTVVAGAAFIGEHSYSSPEKPIAMGRPDAEDERIAHQFGADLMKKLSGEPAPLKGPELPGTLPQGPYPGPAHITPTTDPTLCTLCGHCIEICPTGAITLGESLTTDASRCTFCCACLKACPEHAITMAIPALLEKVATLYTHCQRRREPELFL